MSIWTRIVIVLDILAGILDFLVFINQRNYDFLVISIVFFTQALTVWSYNIIIQDKDHKIKVLQEALVDKYFGK